MDAKYIRSLESVRIGQDATELLREHKERETKRLEDLSGIETMAKTLRRTLTTRETDPHVCTQS